MTAAPIAPRHAPTALIAEDEPLLARALQADLAAVWPQLQVLAQALDGEQAVEDALALRPDVLFLDIRMPGRSGLAAAQAIVEDWPDGAPLPLIVFITAYDAHALQAFELAAVDYLLKPAPRERLAQTCERLRQRLVQRPAPASAATAAAGAATIPTTTAHDEALLLQRLRLLLAQPGLLAAAPVPAPALSADVPEAILAHAGPRAPGAAPWLSVIQAGVGSAVVLVPIEDVLVFEAADKYVRVLTAERELLIRMPLRELLPQLDPERFWQVHRGTVVQAREIAQALRDESGRITLQLRRRPEPVVVSRLYAARFKAM
ncbi:LytR/AlgR family response regulator transcription factor [Pseudaquabacterium rugosum]|uniref:LytTR family DNA-binding domain-containing protein n=1 Tax=Pseudaquabacterium rugosum TaxID=2984194 RepID=A0ABU9BCB4_9BURK